MSEGVTIVDPVTGLPLAAQATLANCYMIIGHQIFEYVIPRVGSQVSPYLREPLVINCQNYAIGLSMITKATVGQFIKLDIAGEPDSGGVGVIT